MNTTADLAEQITDLVSATPEVLLVYPAHRTPIDLASHVLSAVVAVRALTPVRVTETDTGTTIAISVGISGQRSAVAVCRDLYNHIATYSTATGAAQPLTISIKIASIN